MLQLQKLFAFSLLVGVSVKLAEQEALERIYGGTSTTTWDYPFIVSIKGISGTHICGGSIISANTIITAAHCAPFDKLVAGAVYKEDEPDQTSIWSHTIKWIKVHENYTKINDVAIARINGKFTFGPNIMPISLSSDTFVPPGTEVTILGWGHRVDSDEESVSYTERDFPLQVATIKVISREECGKSYATVAVETNVCVHDAVSKKMPCLGDSGGPLVIDNVLFGVASRSYNCGTGLPAVYVLLGHYTDWIRRYANVEGELT